MSINIDKQDLLVHIPPRKKSIGAILAKLLPFEVEDNWGRAVSSIFPHFVRRKIKVSSLRTLKVRPLLHPANVLAQEELEWHYKARKRV